MSRQQHYADSLLEPLDKSQISTHILYDRVAPMARLDGFNLHYNNPDTSNVHHFLQAYYELHQADYASSGTAPCRQLLADNARHYQQHDTVLIGALRYRFNYIDSNAVRNNQLRWDTSAPSRLYDVAGRSSSPYLLREVAVVAALADSIRSSTVSFRLDPASIFTNTGGAVRNVSIDFGDGGGAQTCAPGQVIQISYSTSGRKVLRYVMNYSDGSQFTTYSVLYVPTLHGVAASCTNCRTSAAEPIPACYTQKLTSAITFQGIAGQAEVTYYYSTNPGKICNSNGTTSGTIFSNVTKPIIIVDGIDYDGSRKGPTIFSEYLNYQDGTQTRNLGRQLQDAGYDVVIIDFPNVERRVKLGPFIYNVIDRHSGADYMERNAFSLVTLIQQLNAQMQAAGSTEKIVVQGPSMGGQIARYALAYMEHNNLPHNTRLYVSLDSPHNGATIPIGLQHFVQYFADATEEEELVAGLAELDSPAARELVQHHHSQGTAFGPHPDRVQFLNDLTTFGNYPSQLRRVAVANGSLDGTAQIDQNSRPLGAGQQMFVFEQRGVPGYPFSWVTGLLTRLVTNASARVYYEPGYGQTQQVLASYYAFKGRHAQEATGPSGSCGLDSSPGSYRKFVSFAQSSGGLTQERNFYSVRDRACFIPTLSALGYTQSADNCQAVGKNLVCTNATPFDAYYGPTGHNEEHVQLTLANVEFIRNEILLKTPTPVFLTAPTELCVNGSAAAFSVAGECVASRTDKPQPGTTYAWAVGSGLQIVGGQGTGTVQVQPFAGFSGTNTVTVVATRLGYAASAPTVAQVRVGSAYVQLSGPSGPECYFTTLTYSLTSSLTQQNVEWHVYLDNVQHDEFIQQNYTTSLLVQPTATGYLQITASDTETCSSNQIITAYASTTIVSQIRNPDGSFSLCSQFRPPRPTKLVAYPNPANNTLTLSDAESTGSGTVGTVVLYNTYGREVRRVTGALQLSTTDLPAGLYHAVVQQDGQIKQCQIRISH